MSAVQSASKTAELVAAVRATYHHGPEAQLFDDPLAVRMLGPTYRLLCSVAVLREGFLRGRLFNRLKSSLTVLSRARYAEDRLASAAAQGVTQYVILGAGFDSFAFRAGGAFKGVRVFEVDTPESQQVKKARVQRLVPRLAHHYVPVDFTCDKVEEQLLAAGFDPAARSFFAWQGVLIYLSEAAITRTLRGIAGIAAEGSQLVVDFIDARLFDQDFLATIPDIAADLERFLAYAAKKGEPILGGFRPDDFAALARPLGWDMVHTVTSKDHVAQFLDGPPDYRWPTEFDHLATLARVQ